MTTAGAAPGIYTLWVQGQAGAPYLTTKFEPIPVKIGTVNRDFTITADASIKAAADAGDTVTFTLNLNADHGTAFGGPVALSLDGAAPHAASARRASAPQPSRRRTATARPQRSRSTPGRWRPAGTGSSIRATGMNGDSTPRPVTHLLQVWVDVATGGRRNSEYVDIVGFAVMRIVAMPTRTPSAPTRSPL